MGSDPNGVTEEEDLVGELSETLGSGTLTEYFIRGHHRGTEECGGGHPRHGSPPEAEEPVGCVEGPNDGKEGRCTLTFTRPGYLESRFNAIDGCR